MALFDIFKWNKKTSNVVIDEKMIKESRLSKTRSFTDYKKYADKPVDWLLAHLKVIDEVVSGVKFGTKQQSHFLFEGRKVLKNDYTKPLFNDMMDNYTAYYYALKRLIILKRELGQLKGLREEEYLVAGKQKDLVTELNDIERNLNIYLENITTCKSKIKEDIFNPARR